MPRMAGTILTAESSLPLIADNAQSCCAKEPQMAIRLTIQQATTRLGGNSLGYIHHHETRWQVAWLYSKHFVTITVFCGYRFAMQCLAIRQARCNYHCLLRIPRVRLLLSSVVARTTHHNYYIPHISQKSSLAW